MIHYVNHPIMKIPTGAETLRLAENYVTQAMRGKPPQLVDFYIGMNQCLRLQRVRIVLSWTGEETITPAKKFIIEKLDNVRTSVWN